MIVFICSVLLLACWQSFCKWALLPWKFIFGGAVLLSALPFCFEEKIASVSMKNLRMILTDPAVLENFCAVVVIQELFTLLVGFSLLQDRAGEVNVYRPYRNFPGWLKKWKYLLLKKRESYFCR